MRGLIFLFLFLLSCSAPAGRHLSTLRDIPLVDAPVGRLFSLAGAAGAGSGESPPVYLIYPNISSLSLDVLSLRGGGGRCTLAAGRTTYLDRIAFSPEISSDFGRHLFLSGGGREHIFYQDREDEERTVVKWLSRAPTDAEWWVDILPEPETPLAGRANPDGSVELVSGREGKLYRRTLVPEAALRQDRQLRDAGPLDPAGEVSVITAGLSNRDGWGFTAYDTARGLLYLFQPYGAGLSRQALFPGGRVHFSTVVDGEFLLLLFDPGESRLLLLEKPAGELAPSGAQGDAGPMKVVPVTPCEETTSVYLAVYQGRRYFLFTERRPDTDGQPHYALSLLYPLAEQSANPYRRVSVLDSPDRIVRFTALRRGDCLYVAYLTRNLGLLSFSLDDPALGE